MKWNYRIMRNLDGHLELVEAYYNDDGLIFDIIRPPLFGAIVAMGEGINVIDEKLRRARHATKKPIINETELNFKLRSEQ